MWNKTLMLSERARHIKLYIVWFHLYEMLGKDKTVEIESRSSAAEDWRGLEMGVRIDCKQA